ncbi:MAG TPA: histidine phosphatase family protein, partial [Opitutus sp.]|nr:histidine phosphatase family protein [Opitutus sp.]
RDRGLGVELCDSITEVEFGEWTGASLSGLAPQERWRRFNTFRSGTPIPGGETALAVQARFVSEMLRLRDARPGGGVALVSHANPIRHGRWRFKGRLSGASGRLGETSLLLKRKRPALQRAW